MKRAWHVVVPTSFIGRAGDIARIDAASAAGARVVTLHGAPGVGKSRLLRELGVRVVDLQSATDVLAQIARTLGLEPSEDPLAAIVDHVGDRSITLGLDPFEHVLDAAPLLSDLVDALPALRLVIASRERTRIPGEQVVIVEPLSHDDAVALFLERARAVAPRRSLDEGVHALVDRLDRLPLAIELAAARTPSLSPIELLARIDDRPLRAAIDASYALLDEDERVAFCACAVFRGGFTLEAAEAVLGPRAHAHLDRLVAHALVVASDDGNRTRFSMLETLRDEAARRSADDEAARRHARWFASWAERASPTRRARERDNLLAALDRANATDMLRLAVALDSVLVAEGPYDLHREVLARALEVESACTLPSLRASLLRARGRYLGLRGGHREAHALHRRARDLHRDAGDVRGEGWAEAMLSFTAQALGDENALAHAEAARACANGDEPLEAFAEMMMGLSENARGAFEAGHARLRRAAAIARAADAPRLAGLALANAAMTARRLCNVDDARASLDEARTLLGGVGDRLHQAKVATVEAGLLRDVGALDEAETLLIETIAQLSLFGDPQGETEARLELAAVALDRGDVRLARRALDDAGACLRKVEHVELHRLSRALEARLQTTTSKSRTLRVAHDGRHFVYGARRVELGRRGVTRRVLLAFVRQRLASPGVGLSVHDVFSAGWPGERVVGTSGLARVYMTIRTLRALGLEGALLTRDDGYLLDPNLEVMEVAADGRACDS